MKKLTAESKNIMYKVFLDTNILLDYLIAQREGHIAAQRIIEMTVEDKLLCYASPISLINIFFILRKQKTEQERKDIIESFLEILNIVELDAALLQTGLYLPISDYEDGAQYMCAVKANVDFIITADQSFQKHDLELNRISANDFLRLIPNQND